MHSKVRHKHSWGGGIRLIVLGCVVLLMFPAIASAESPAKELFIDALIPENSYQMQTQGFMDEAVLRSRLVWVDFAQLAGEEFPDGAQSAVLNLFRERSFVAVKERMERRAPSRYTWFGVVKGMPLSQAIIVVEGDNMAANIVVDGEVYQVRPMGDGIHVIREIDQSAFPDEAPPVPVGISADADLDFPIGEPDDGSIIDVMVVYTPDAAAAAGSITALIQLGIAETNASYTNSGINQRLRLVHSAEVAYTETGSLNTELSRLRGTSDGHMDEVHTLRDTHGADVVSLWVANGGGYCGMAYLMDSVSGSFATWAFSVVATSCATGYYSFGHELGHNMAARHDWYVDKTVNSPYTYNKGFVNTTDQWRTIMAYNSECTDLGFSCTRLQYWSNPDVTYGGDPMGVPEGMPEAADNRKTLNNTAYTVANFRQSVAPNPLTTINLDSPQDLATASAPPTFTWIVDGGTANVYAVDFYLLPSGPLWSTFDNMHILVNDTSWTMPTNLWNMIPAGRMLNWRVRGADLDDPPPSIVTSDEVWTFNKD